LETEINIKVVRQNRKQMTDSYHILWILNFYPST